MHARQQGANRRAGLGIGVSEAFTGQSVKDGGGLAAQFAQRLAVAVQAWGGTRDTLCREERHQGEIPAQR